MSTATGGRALSATLRERISISDLLVALGDWATAALLFIFAFPNVLPTPPGTSTVLGAPLIFLAAQPMLGRAPWLLRAESLLRPRLDALARPWMEHLIGLASLLLAVVLVLPIPLSNVLPALALGVLERDGVWVLAGIVVSGAAVSVVSGVVFALVKAGVYFFAQAVS